MRYSEKHVYACTHAHMVSCCNSTSINARSNTRDVLDVILSVGLLVCRRRAWCTHDHTFITICASLWTMSRGGTNQIDVSSVAYLLRWCTLYSCSANDENNYFLSSRITYRSSDLEYSYRCEKCWPLCVEDSVNTVCCQLRYNTFTALVL